MRDSETRGGSRTSTAGFGALRLLSSAHSGAISVLCFSGGSQLFSVPRIFPAAVPPSAPAVFHSELYRHPPLLRVQLWRSDADTRPGSSAALRSEQEGGNRSSPSPPPPPAPV